METPEQQQKRLAAIRLRYHQKRCSETPEEAQIRRLKENIRRRKLREKRQALLNGQSGGEVKSVTKPKELAVKWVKYLKRESPKARERRLLRDRIRGLERYYKNKFRKETERKLLVSKNDEVETDTEGTSDSSQVSTEQRSSTEENHQLVPPDACLGYRHDHRYLTDEPKDSIVVVNKNGIETTFILGSVHLGTQSGIEVDHKGEISDILSTSNDHKGEISDTLPTSNDHKGEISDTEIERREKKRAHHARRRKAREEQQIVKPSSNKKEVVLIQPIRVLYMRALNRVKALRDKNIKGDKLKSINELERYLEKKIQLLNNCANPAEQSCETHPLEGEKPVQPSLQPVSLEMEVEVEPQQIEEPILTYIKKEIHPVMPCIQDDHSQPVEITMESEELQQTEESLLTCIKKEFMHLIPGMEDEHSQPMNIKTEPEELQQIEESLLDYVNKEFVP